MITKTETKKHNLKARAKAHQAQDDLVAALRILEDYPDLPDVAEFHLAAAVADAKKALKQIRRLMAKQTETKESENN